jgi:predicted permease
MKNALVVAEVALSVVLLVGAGLFLRSFVSGAQADPGFDLAPLMTLRFDMPGDRYASAGERTRLVEDVVVRLAALPGVLSAAASDLDPLRGGGSRATAVPEGRAGVAGESGGGPSVLYGGVTSRFFETLDVPIVRGRGFAELEAGTRSGVAVVNQALAGRLWPGEDPIGRRFRLDDDPERTWFRVIGVARDILTWDLSDRPWPSAFLPWAHVAVRAPGVVLRVSGRPGSFAAPARDAIQAADATLPVFAERSMEDVQRLTFWRRRLLSGLFGSFGAFAVLLAGVGAYGVLSYWVQRRTREIGVRMALGASRGDVVGLIVRQGMAPVLGGIGLGLLGGVALTRVLRGRLYELNGVDPIALAAVLLLLGTVGLLSSYWPARRAAGVDPIQALRD